VLPAAPEVEDVEEDDRTPTEVTWAEKASPSAAFTVTVARWPTFTLPTSDSERETCIV
jgi:hypothetical protein